MENIKIAGAQISSELGNISANLEKHLDFISDAKAKNVDLLIFPELSLTGYSIGAHGYKLARSMSSAEVTKIAEAAANITVLFGLMEEGNGAQFYNSVVSVSDGKVNYLHRKLNLPSYGKLEESKYFASGRFVQAHKFSGPWSYSALICADAWNPALVHLSAMHGATMLVLPISSSTDAVDGDFSNPQGWDVACKFYAMMYGFPVIRVNRVGNEFNSVFYGGSAVYCPSGKVLFVADDQEILFTQSLDYEDVRKSRYWLPTVRDSNISLIEREIVRLTSTMGIPEQLFIKR